MKCIDVAYNEVFYKQRERIYNRWADLIKMGKDSASTIPIGVVYRMNDNSKDMQIQKTGTHVTIPLNGGGELRISRSEEKYEKEGVEEPETDRGPIIIGITAHGTHGGALVKHPDTEWSPFFSSHYNMNLNFVDQEPRKKYDFSDPKKIAPILNFMALFDPARDIDFAKMGTPDEGQAACLKALHVNLPVGNKP